MLTRFIRIQLTIFGVVSLIGLVVMATVYMKVPTQLGWGRIAVTLELPAGGGLYEQANITYRGIQVGKVDAVTLTPTGAKATLSLDSSRHIPANLVAEVRSVSAIGEQYVDLRPFNESPPYLSAGAVIPVSRARIPRPVGPMLDSLNRFLGRIPKDSLHTLVDESSDAFAGSRYDLGSLVDSAATFTRDTDRIADRAATLVNDGAPFLDAQARSADSLRIWARSVSGVTGQLVRDDPQLRNILNTAPGALDETARLLAQIKPTLPVLLANLTSLGQVAVTYRPSLEQILVLLPPVTAYYQSSRATNNPTGIPLGDFRIQISDPPSCTVGFLPQSQWRSPADTTTIDTPTDLYCKLPQDAPVAVKGARNLPCMGHPGKRAPTVAICDSDRPYEPLAMRQHILGPGPLDPTMIAAGIPPDDRVPGQAPIFGPVEGTPPPQNLPAPPAAPPGPRPSGALPPGVAPSSNHNSAPAGPTVAVAEYDPRTGRYLDNDGRAARQADLATNSAATWKDLILPPEL
jgi:phospholipid/cholesterol/gamma-HCH transport system substrate-binding protein